MRFEETPLCGAFVVQPERLEDERGFFARTWCRDEFSRQGLSPELSQCNLSFNARRHTLRGMHYQRRPHGEIKLVRCTTGAIFDVIVDLRRDSATYLKWFGIELSAENRQMLYIPEDFAHGFLTLCDGAEVFYQMSTPFVAGFGAGVRWNDPAFAIAWPALPDVISERDNSYADFVADRKPDPVRSAS
jgi:dTDP-4-dehydrorhamnose 3,5-epimerase